MGFESFKNSSNHSLFEKMSEKIEINVQGSPREELIRTAINFLSNPNVKESPMSQKEAFLKKKGLTTEEIKIAFEKTSNHLITGPAIYQNYLADSGKSAVQVSQFQKFKDILHIITLIGGASYGLYCLYKKFIEPIFFEKGKKPKTLENSITNLNRSLEKSIADLKSDMQKVQNELEKVTIMQNEQHSSSKLIGELKSEMATVKGILLSRHQFSSVSLSAPSIPAWQLTQSSHKDDKESLENDDGEHNSGSSETEIVPNPNSNGGSQGSDSSLEMIKEVDN